MLKARLIRDYLTQHNEWFRHNPDALRIFISHGQIIATAGASNSFEYRYTLELLIINYAADPDTLIAPLVQWMRVHQQEALSNETQREKAISFEAEALDHNNYDLQISLRLSERVLVHPQGKGIKVRHCPDNPPEL